VKVFRGVQLLEGGKGFYLASDVQRYAEKKAAAAAGDTEAA
jgi:hypothetical protein